MRYTQSHNTFIALFLIIFTIAIIGNNELSAQLRYDGKYMLIGPDSMRNPKQKLYISGYNGMLFKYHSNQFKIAKIGDRICLSGAGGFVDFVNKDDYESYVYGQIKCYDYHISSGNGFQYVNILNSSALSKIGAAPNRKFLSALENLRSVNFAWKETAECGDNTDIEEATVSADKEIGLIAQEVELLFPELVSTDDAGNKLVNYLGLLPLLVNALNELNGIIDSQQSEIEQLQQLLATKQHENKLK